MTVTVDNDRHVIEIDHPITSRSLYSALMDIFDEPQQMVERTPMEAVPTDYTFNLINGWSIEAESQQYLLDGDVKDPEPPPPVPAVLYKDTLRKVVIRRFVTGP